MAEIVDLAEAVKDKLSTSGAFTPPLGAQRTYQLFYELADDALKVAVYGTADDSTSKIDRTRWKHELTIDVAVQQRLADDDNAGKAAIVAIADGICE